MIPTLLGATVVFLLVLRHHDIQGPRRSLFQIFIRNVGSVARWTMAVSEGFDRGYAAYRRALREITLNFANEEEHGLVIPAAERRFTARQKRLTT